MVDRLALILLLVCILHHVDGQHFPIVFLFAQEIDDISDGLLLEEEVVGDFEGECDLGHFHDIVDSLDDSLPDWDPPVVPVEGSKSVVGVEEGQPELPYLNFELVEELEIIEAIVSILQILLSILDVLSIGGCYCKLFE